MKSEMLIAFAIIFGVSLIVTLVACLISPLPPMMPGGPSNLAIITLIGSAMYLWAVAALLILGRLWT